MIFEAHTAVMVWITVLLDVQPYITVEGCLLPLPPGEIYVGSGFSWP